MQSRTVSRAQPWPTPIASCRKVAPARAGCPPNTSRAHLCLLLSLGRDTAVFHLIGRIGWDFCKYLGHELEGGGGGALCQAFCGC